MAFIVNGVKTVRSNWKKSVFFSGVLVYAGKYIQRRYDESLMRQAFCLEAERYGALPTKTGERLRRLTVFLNPAASKGRARQLFDKNVAPILHLAGIEVTVVKTEYEGQAKKYMEVMEDTDGILVAGGDGTLLEVVTGLLRREDSAQYAARVPVGVVPLGYTNHGAARLLGVAWEDSGSVARQLEAAMAVVRGRTTPVPVIHIKGEQGRDVYAVSGVQWGVLSSVQDRQIRAWYMGETGRRWWARLREALRLSWPARVTGELAYTQPCEGCSRCYVPPPPVQWRWWHLFLQPRQPPVTKDYSDVENPECGQERRAALDSLHLGLTLDDQGSALTMAIAPSDTARTEFVQNTSGGEKEWQHRETIRAGKVTLTPKAEQPQYMIDNEEFEVMRISAQPHSCRLQMFAPAQS